MNLLSFWLNCFLLLLEVLYVLEDWVVELCSNIVFKLLICFVFVNIHDLAFYLLLLLSTYWSTLCLFLELIFRNVNQVWNIASWLCIFWCFSSSKAEVLFFLTHLGSWCFFILSFVLFSFFDTLLFGECVVSYISDSRFIDIPKLEEKLSNLSERLNIDIISFSLKEILSNNLLFMLLFRSIGLVVNSTSICQSIMHCKLLLKFFYIFFVFF